LIDVGEHVLEPHGLLRGLGTSDGGSACYREVFGALRVAPGAPDGRAASDSVLASIDASPARAASIALRSERAESSSSSRFLQLAERDEARRRAAAAGRGDTPAICSASARRDLVGPAIRGAHVVDWRDSAAILSRSAGSAGSAICCSRDVRAVLTRDSPAAV
jgi:hypothetical protein